MGAGNAMQAKNALLEATKKELSMVSLRSQAQLLLSRIRLHLEPGHSAAYNRRNHSREYWEKLQWTYYNRKGPQVFLS